MIKSILFDLDGVLVNATNWHKLSLNKALKEISGLEINEQEHISIYNGLPTKKKLDILLSENKILSKDYDKIWNLKQLYTSEIINDLAKPDNIKMEMLSWAKECDYNLACVTNSIYSTAYLMLEKTAQFQYIDILITSNMIRYHKPNSEGYILAMLAFGTRPDETLIIEDSAPGIMAAKNTGAHVWELPDDTTIELTLENLRKKITSG